jgi:Ca2+-binding RTX toxin-like protein
MALQSSWTGTTGNDSLQIDNKDILALSATALAGNDTLTLYLDSEGSDIDAGSGDDSIGFYAPTGGTGTPNIIDTIVRGGDGNDTIDVEPGDYNRIAGSLFNGNGGNDTILVYARTINNSSVFGGQGDDTLNVNAEEAIAGLLFNGNAGNDSVYLDDNGTATGTGENLTVFGGQGTDYLVSDLVQVSNSLFSGDNGDDTVAVASDMFNVTVRGGADNDTILIHGDADAGTVINGNEGDDSVCVDAVLIDGTAQGGQGNDSIFVSESEAVVNGNLGDDSIFVSVHDGGIVFGGKGDDSIYVSAGDGTIAGNLGSDTLAAGAGADTFQYTFGDTSLVGISGADSIESFDAAGSDKIDLTDGDLVFNIAGLTGGITINADAVITGGVTGLGGFINAGASLTTSGAAIGVQGSTIGLGAGEGFIFVSNGNGSLDSDDLLIRFNTPVTALTFSGGDITAIV